MSNLFQTQPKPFSSQAPGSLSRRKATGWKSGFLLLSMLAGLLCFLWLARDAAWLPESFRRLVVNPGNKGEIYGLQGELSLYDARKLYRQALNDLESGSFQAALDAFKKLESLYPGLQGVLWLHQAECYAGLGNEWAAQKKLSAIIADPTESPLKTLALYRIGQSQFRGSDWKKAQETFAQVREKAPESAYALGSLYYIGASQAKQLNGKGDVAHAKATAPLVDYLRACPDCKFSGDAADLLEKVSMNPTPEVHALIGVGQAFASRDLKRTLAHLLKGERAIGWLALGKAQLQLGQAEAGLKTLSDGLVSAKDTEQARSAVDLILSHTAQKVQALKLLAARQLKTGGDYVFWKLAELDPEQAKTYYAMSLKAYPQGDYAPESAWRLIWPLVLDNDDAGYISHVQQYLSTYPYARSAPKALFWLGKLLEKSNPTEAIRAYQQTIRQYEGTYYAFRAKGRLKTLVEGKVDPGWPTFPDRTDFPAKNTDLNTLDILPSTVALGGGATGELVRNQAKELQAIGATEDCQLLVTEAMQGQTPAAVESWSTQLAGERPKGLRIIRDALEKRAKESFLKGAQGEAPVTASQDELKLLYPVYFSDAISVVYRKNRLDPFLIQALMREESYFNEFAISTSNARGLMQLLPSTAQDVAQWEGISGFQTSQLFLPDLNIRLGSRYLSHLHELFNGSSMPSVGAYNGGPGAMSRWVQASPYFASDPDMFVERIPYEQSRDYIKKVFAGYWNYTRLYGRPAM